MHVLTYGYYKLIFGCLELGAAARKKRLVRSSASHQIKEKNASIYDCRGVSQFLPHSQAK